MRYLALSLCAILILASLYYQSQNELWLIALVVLALCSYPFAMPHLKTGIAFLFLLAFFLSSIQMPSGSVASGSLGVLSYVFFAILVIVALSDYLVEKYAADAKKGKRTR